MKARLENFNYLNPLEIAPKMSNNQVKTCKITLISSLNLLLYIFQNIYRYIENIHRFSTIADGKSKWSMNIKSSIKMYFHPVLNHIS